MPLPPELVSKKRKAAGSGDALSKVDEKTREGLAAAIKAAKERSKTLWSDMSGISAVSGPKPMPELNFGSRQDRLEYVAFAGALLREFLLQSETSYNAASHPGAQQSEAQRLNEGATQPDGAGAPDAWTGEQPAAQAPDAPAAAPAAKKVKGIRVGQWRKAATPEGEVYWYHAGTRETRWETPEFTEAELSELAAAEAVAAAAEHSRQLLLEQHEQEQEQAAQQQREEHGRERSEGAAGARPSNGDAAADGAADAGADGDARAAAAAAAAEEASSTVLAPVEPAKPAPGWYYADYAGNIQGPFSVEQMQSWRGHLPMEIPVWRVAEADTDAGYESSAADSLANVLGDSQLLADLRRGLLYPLPSNATAVQAEQQRGMLAARAADPSTWAAAYSAGQTEEERARAALLAATVGVAAEPRGMGAASSSGAWAEAGSGRREEAEDGGDNGGGFSAADLAAAVMEGLTEEGRLEILMGQPQQPRGGGGAGPFISQAPPPPPPVASAALAGGYQPPPPVEGEDLEFSSDPYSFGAVYNKMTGRLTAINVPRGEDAKRLAAELVRGRSAGVYFDPHLDHFLDTTQLQSWAQDKAEASKTKMPPAVWKKLRDEKQARKQAQSQAWLRD